MTRTTLLIVLFAASLVFTACEVADLKPTEASTPAVSQTTEEGSGADHDQDSETAAIEFEPAYPTEVSSEGLSDQDIAQQKAEHSHAGGEPHTHDDADPADHHAEGGTDGNHDH